MAQKNHEYLSHGVDEEWGSFGIIFSPRMAQSLMRRMNTSDAMRFAKKGSYNQMYVTERKLRMKPHLICSGFTMAVAFSLAASSAGASDSTFTEAQICKAGIGTLMGRDPKIIKITKQDKGIVYLYYVRRDDGTKWSYRCKIEGSKVVWASDTGRWRTDPLDERISYRTNGKSLEIIQNYSDGSSTKESFKSSQIGN